MTSIAPPKRINGEYLTVPEIAFLAGVKRGTAEHWRLRKEGTPGQFLEPDDYIGSTPVWELGRICAWLDVNATPAVGKRDATKQYDVEAYRAHRDAGGFRRKPKR